MKDRYKVIPAVYLIFRKENQVLLWRRFQTGYADGNYTVPAGHVESDESPTTCAVREAFEEVGLEINEKDLIFSNVIYNNKEESSDTERIDFFFEVLNWVGDPKNTEPEKCDDVGWFDLNSLPDNLENKTRLGLELYKQKKYYSERGFSK